VIPLIPGVTWLEAAMMGRQNNDQASLFYAFRLDDRVPKDHLLRRIDVFVTEALGGMHARLKPYYSKIGRPSIDPELMIRMLIIGYCYGLRSERRLTRRLHNRRVGRLSLFQDAAGVNPSLSIQFGLVGRVANKTACRCIVADGVDSWNCGACRQRSNLLASIEKEPSLETGSARFS
jgi:hypothetical protein